MSDHQCFSRKKVKFAPISDCNVPYMRVCTSLTSLPEHEHQTLDVYVAQNFASEHTSAGKMMPVIMFLGGRASSFYADNKTAEKQFAKSLAKTGGLVVVVPNYRLHSEQSEEISDSLLALQWVKANVGWYGGDCNNISAIGWCSSYRNESLLQQLMLVSQVRQIVKRVLFAEDERMAQILLQPHDMAVACLAAPWISVGE